MSAPPVDTSVLQVCLPREDKAFFLELLDDSGIQYSEWMLKAQVDTLIDIARDSGPWATAFAAVIWKYLDAKARRKFSITVDKKTVFSCEGLSQKEVESLLSRASSLNVSKETSNKK